MNDSNNDISNSRLALFSQKHLEKYGLPVHDALNYYQRTILNSPHFERMAKREQDKIKGYLDQAFHLSEVDYSSGNLIAAVFNMGSTWGKNYRTPGETKRSTNIEAKNKRVGMVKDLLKWFAVTKAKEIWKQYPDQRIKVARMSNILTDHVRHYYVYIKDEQWKEEFPDLYDLLHTVYKSPPSARTIERWLRAEQKENPFIPSYALKKKNTT